MKSFKALLCVTLLLVLTLLTSCSQSKTTVKETQPTTTTESAPTYVDVVDSIEGNIQIIPCSNVPKSTIDTRFLDISNGAKKYNDGDTYSVFGIDVSSYTGYIQWDKVKASGVEFAIIRIGGRGYGNEGNIYDDNFFDLNYKGATEQGVDVGVYFFSQAITKEEAVEEAEYVLKQLDGAQLQLPVVYDFEFVENEDARTNNISGAQMTEFAKAFCETIQNAGYDAMIYGESNDFYSKYDLSQLENVPLWYAEYAEKPNFYYEYKIWQYSQNGLIDGIMGIVDLNIMFVND